MKKYVIILICLLFLSGCDAAYEIKIYNNKIEENLTLIERNHSLFDLQNDDGWTLRQMFDSLLETQGDEFSHQNYSIKSLNSDTELGVEYHADDAANIINSSALNQCYMNPKMSVENNIVTINTGDNFKCYEYYEYLESVSVILTTNHKVISSNAHKVEDNKYIWNLTKDGDKQIEFSYDKSTSSKINIIIIICSIVGFFLVAGISLYIYIRIKNQNKI